jgi:hypothetical protein
MFCPMLKSHMNGYFAYEIRIGLKIIENGASCVSIGSPRKGWSIGTTPGTRESR